MSLKSPINVDLNPLSYFPPEICDSILQHVTGAELLLASEVSTFMYSYIAESEKCMSKIKVKLEKESIPDDVKLSLVKKGRKYENLELNQFAGLLEAAKEILSAPGRKWKIIVIKCLDFETIADVVDLLSTFEATVVELLMDQVYVKSLYKRRLSNLTFPELKRLETKCCQALLYQEAFAKITKLKNFSIKSGGEFYLDAIKNILRSNVDLKVLGIHFNIFNLMFFQDSTNDFRFTLKEFRADNLYRVAGCYALTKINFHKFLLTQQGSIEILSIDDWMGIDVLKTIFSMPCLKNVSIKAVHRAGRFVDWDSLELSQNTTIKKLDFNDMLNNTKALEKVLEAAPNLSWLKLYAMDLVKTCCPNLVTLFVENLHAADFSDANLFMNLQKFTFKKSWGSLLTIQPNTHFGKLVYRNL